MSQERGKEGPGTPLDAKGHGKSSHGHRGRGMAAPMPCPSCHSEGDDTFAENPLGIFF